MFGLLDLSFHKSIPVIDYLMELFPQIRSVPDIRYVSRELSVLLMG